MANSPNLLFIFSDRQRYDTMRCYGNDWIKTPNLNALSEQSFVFQNAYVTQAVCAPARSSIMTGLYPHAAGMPRNKLVMRQDAKSIAEMVSGDYLRAYFGKWHLGDEVVRQHGFEEWVSVMERLWAEYTSPEYLGRHTDYHQFLLDSGLKPDQEAPGGDIFSDEMRSNLPAELQMASFLAGRAASFIESNKDRPFILYVSFLEPHPPFNGPYNDLYDPEELPVEPTFLKKPEGASLFNRVRADFFMQSEFDGHDLSTEAGWRRLRANYLANITLVDDAVGKIVGALDGAGLAENTIVVFTSDHGYLLGHHDKFQKQHLFEESTRVPFIVSVPWMKKQRGKGTKHITELIDLYPTLADLSGLKAPKNLQGESMVPLLKNPSSDDWKKDLAFTISRSGGESIRTHDWRFTQWGYGAKGMELYDRRKDPGEFTNLAGDPNYDKPLKKLKAQLEAKRADAGYSAKRFGGKKK
jgi:arylsulfatase A-like enzyme